MARFRMLAVSTISTMKVERPWEMKSDAPLRTKMRSTRQTLALSAGTKLPIWERRVIKATWRIKTDLPAMLGPVMIRSWWSLPRIVSLGTKLCFSMVVSTMGWRDSESEIVPLVLILGHV